MNKMIETGQKLAKLHLGKDSLQATEALSPALSQFVVEHGFAVMYANEDLDQKSRKIAAIASLITSGSLPQLEWHVRGALENALMNQAEIEQLIIQMTIYIGYPAAFNAMSVAKKVFIQHNGDIEKLLAKNNFEATP